MTLSCFRASRLLERRAAGLSEAERLRLEQHLAGCAACREDSAVIARLAELSERAAIAAHAAGPRDRLIARALGRPDRSEVAPEARARRWPGGRLALLAPVFAVLVLGVVGAFAVLRLVRSPASGALPVASPAAPEAGARVIAGGALSGDRRLSAGDPVPEHTEMTLLRDTEIAVAHARVRVTDEASVRWDAAQSSLELLRGGVDVLVDPRPKRPFSVETSRFRVDVVGTEFHVDASLVSVFRGHVRVVGAGAEGELLAELDAGQSFQPANPSVAPPPPPDSSAPPSAARQPDVNERLSFARRALAASDVARARDQIASLLAQHPSAGQQAEAHMLLGDAARISGDSERATSEYLGVFEKFRALPWAETALFSAARVQARAGHGARAEQLFSRYLAQYPHGQFQKQALEGTRAASGPP